MAACVPLNLKGSTLAFVVKFVRETPGDLGTKDVIGHAAVVLEAL